MMDHGDYELPSDHRAEASVLGSLLLDPEALLRVMPLLRPEDFHRARNRYCYEACLNLFGEQGAIDLTTLMRELTRLNRLDAVGGPTYLSSLITETPTSVNVEYYARIVADLGAKRQLIAAGKRIADLGYAGQSGANEAIRQAIDVLFSVQPVDTDQGFIPLGRLLDPYLQRGDAADDDTPDAPPLPSGYRDIDSLLGGMQRSDMLIVGARPGLGKSSLALNIALNVAKSGLVCGIFSLEMSRDQVAMRILVAETGIDSHRMRRGLFSEREEDDIIHSIGELSDLPIYVDDAAFQTTLDLRGKAHRLKLEHGLDFLVVDYLQLIQGQGRRGGENRVQEISEISRSLKGMARDLNVPVLVCSQLSRGIENRPGHRPQLSDLRDSGSIEQDADIVMFLYREDKHYTEAEWEQHAPGRPYPKNFAEVIVAKHRHGPTGNLHLYFNDRLMRFDELQLPRQEDLAA